MPFISNLMKKARENSFEAGIILFALCSVIFFIPSRILSLLTYQSIFVGFILFADIQLLIGAIIGLRFTLKNQEPEQKTLKNGVLTGVGGGALSAIFIGCFDWTFFSILSGQINLPYLFFLILFLLISGLVIGLLMGALMTTFYMHREAKISEENKHIDEEFFKDLIED